MVAKAPVEMGQEETVRALAATEVADISTYIASKVRLLELGVAKTERPVELASQTTFADSVSGIMYRFRS
jgi:hypothetical protein